MGKTYTGLFVSLNVLHTGGGTPVEYGTPPLGSLRSRLLPDTRSDQ